jgi:integrase
MRVRLTDKTCAAAKADASGRTDYFDTIAKGLSLRVTKAGAKSWSLLFTAADGKRARATLGGYPAIGLADARALAVEGRGMVTEGKDPRGAVGAQAARAATVKGLLASYVENHARHLRSGPEIERRFARNVTPVIGGVRLADLTRRHIVQTTDPILARGAPTEATRTHEDVRAALRWALSRGDIERDPTAGMRKPAPARKRERVLSDDEMRALWHVLPTALRRAPATQTAIKLALVSGQRIGEVCGMRKAELDMARRTWTLPGARVKSGHGHIVPLSDLALEILSKALADSGSSEFAFPVDGGKRALDPAAVAVAIFRANAPDAERPLGRFGLAPWTAHDLRRTCATGLQKLGVRLEVTEAILNHRSGSRGGIVGVYQKHDWADEKRAALDLWAEKLRTIVSGQSS